MKRSHLVIVIVLYLFPFSNLAIAARRTSEDGSEKWGYVEVRPKAHMFWWYYRSPYRVEDPNKPWPIILWLQGGPGASGVGIGNFQEVGPLDTNLNPRNSTWLKKADLLFVDNPVGTGYSFVEDKNLFVKTDEEAATDLTTLLASFFNKDQSLQSSPLFIVAESYGGKYAVTLGLSALKAIESGKLKANLGGIALGDSWISPEDFVFSWGPLLKDISRLDDNGLTNSNSLAQQIKQEIGSGKFKDATGTWEVLESEISDRSNNIDFYNFMLDSNMDPLASTTTTLSTGISMKRYSRYLDSLRSSPGGNGASLDDIMNGVIRKKLKIIPNDVQWGGQGNQVFSALSGDFMKPRINEVDELLAKGVNVTVYNGQLDLICATKGTEAWVGKLKKKKELPLMATKKLSEEEDKREKDTDKQLKVKHNNVASDQSPQKDQSKGKERVHVAPSTENKGKPMKGQDEAIITSEELREDTCTQEEKHCELNAVYNYGPHLQLSKGKKNPKPGEQLQQPRVPQPLAPHHWA